MKHIDEVRKVQEIFMNSWPANNYFFLNGWILRFNDGVTWRANSVIPLNYTGTMETIDIDIDMVENAYERHIITPTFYLPDCFKPSYLKDKLIERNYTPFDFTNTMVVKAQNLIFGDYNYEFSYNIDKERSLEFSNFLAEFSSRSKEEQKVIQRLTNKIIIPKKRFITAKNNDEIIGILMAVLEPRQYLYLADILIKPKYRKRAIASTMIKEIIEYLSSMNQIKKIWLQVEKDNIPALRLYQKLGFRTLFKYYYMKKPKNLS